MVNTLKVIRRANLQFIFVIVIVAAIGFWQRMDAAKENSTEEREERIVVESVQGLPVKDKSFYTPNEYSFGTDKQWNFVKKQLEGEYGLYEGTGHINNNSVNVEFILLPNGEIMGRYHHENGTQLDLNGTVNASNGNLLVRLGHEKNKTLSVWRLKPTYTNADEEIYEYEGTWGKKELPSKLTLKRKSN